MKKLFFLPRKFQRIPMKKIPNLTEKRGNS